MPPSRTRYVTACQQLLALGVVVAALTPAASVVSLDVVRQTPGSVPGPGPRGRDEHLRPAGRGRPSPGSTRTGKRAVARSAAYVALEAPRVGVGDQDQ